MKVLIVDDHPVVRTGLRRLLAAESSTEVWEATSGKEALSTFKRQPADLVILDLNLPDIGGLEIIARLKIVDPDVRILVLSMHDDHIHVTRALQAGAAGYVSKTIPPEKLLEAIRRVAGGRTYVEHEIAEELSLKHPEPGAHAWRTLLATNVSLLAEGRGGLTKKSQRAWA